MLFFFRINDTNFLYTFVFFLHFLPSLMLMCNQGNRYIIKNETLRSEDKYCTTKRLYILRKRTRKRKVDNSDMNDIRGLPKVGGTCR